MSWRAWSKESSRGCRRRHSVIQRPKAGTEVGGGRDCAVHEVESRGNGVLEWAAECQARGDGGRQGAASPVGGDAAEKRR